MDKYFKGGVERPLSSVMFSKDLNWQHLCVFFLKLHLIQITAIYLVLGMTKMKEGPKNPAVLRQVTGFHKQKA